MAVLERYVPTSPKSLVCDMEEQMLKHLDCYLDADGDKWLPKLTRLLNTTASTKASFHQFYRPTC